MKRTLLTLGTIFSLALSVNAQTIYTESFTGTTVPTGWTAPASYTLTANNMLSVAMVDSIGPQQPSGPAANWAAFQYVFPTAINMAAGCKCIQFDINNTGNQEMTFAVQAQDVNHDGNNSKYTDQTNVVVAAGFNGTKTVNFAGKFENYYGYPTAGGKLDSTHIIQINLQPLGMQLGAAPWNKKFKGNFTIDNFTVSGIAATTSTSAAQANIASTKLYPNPVSDMAKVELNLKAASSVKITLSDVMGKEVMTVTEGTFSEVTKEFSVANLNKGIYTVNYTINGQAAKAELLMVK